MALCNVVKHPLESLFRYRDRARKRRMFRRIPQCHHRPDQSLPQSLGRTQSGMEPMLIINEQR